MNDPKFKVLEIGGGTGANLDFITEPIEWTVIEPSDCESAYFKEKISNENLKHDFKGVLKVLSVRDSVMEISLKIPDFSL